MAADTQTTVHYRACNLCEAICGLEIRVEDGQIISIRGDKDDPFSRGHICPKAVALQDVHYDPDRLKRPLRRIPGSDGTADRWQEIGWDEAFDWAASRLRTLQDAHGRDAIGFYLGNPNVHNYGNLLYGPPLLRALRSKNRFSATSVDQLPHHFAAYFMFGHQLLLPVPDIDRTDYFLILGANPAVSNGSLMTAPDVKKRLQAIRRRGGEVIVVDPRHTETAKLADRHFFIRPGTDALLLMALLHTVFNEDLTSPGPLAEHADGLDRVRGAADDFAPERVAGAVGIAAEDIRALARDFCAAPSAACYGRMGASTQEFGALSNWLINTFNFVTGNLDRAGGAMFTKPAVDLVARGFGGGSFGRWKSRVRGLPEFGGELPVSALAEEILTPGEGQIRALVTSAGNPVLSTPNGRRLEEALAGLDFMVSIDFYLNETTRHADLILPPTAALEHDHYDIVFHLLAIRNTARYSPPLFDPEEDTRHDWQILHQLRKRLDRNKSLRARAERWLMGRGPRLLLNLGLRSGPTSLNLKKLEKAPHGVDLGALEPCFPGRLKTRNGRIDLAPELLVADVERLAKHLEELDAGSSMVLIGRRQVRSNNSWMHNYGRLMRGKDRCTLLIHPEDAARLGIAADGKAAVSSRVGRVEAPVELSDAIMPGVVSLPHGWGHHRPGVRLETASSRPGVSLNDLTDEQRVDALCGNAAFSGVPVTVEPVG
ncbi:MAG: molybdopterin oxidoreductase family protein [Thermoanaerobaculia bacterium]